MVTFTTLRRPLLPKPEYWLGLFCRFLQQEGSRSSTTLDAFTIIASYGSSSTPVVNFQYEILSNFANVAQNSRSSITLEPFAMKREIWIQPFVFCRGEMLFLRPAAPLINSMTGKWNTTGTSSRAKRPFFN